MAIGENSGMCEQAEVHGISSQAPLELEMLGAAASIGSSGDDSIAELAQLA